MFVKLDRRNDNNEIGIVPLIVPISDVFRNISEKLWFRNVQSSSQIGVEFQSMIVAPQNYAFVGHSLTNITELVVGILSDSAHGEHGK